MITKLDRITLREPDARDGAAVARLVAACPPLDHNSTYCNLLQCSHFANTSVAAFDGEQMVGFISGYLIPNRPDTLFVWQVAVAETARGLGLATAMIANILDRPANHDVRWIETTITETNEASWTLFKRYAHKRNAPFEQDILFHRDKHFHGQHDTEFLLRIGPFARTADTSKPPTPQPAEVSR